MEDMKINIKCRKHAAFVYGLSAASALALMIPSESFAATRTAYFNQSGLNKTINGLSEDGMSTCRITINNPSNKSQTYAVTANISSLDSWNGGDSGTPVSGSLGSGSASGTLAANATVTLVYNFSSYPNRNHTTYPTQSGYQKLRCSGSIVATDVDQPGFLVASGVLVTFVESTKMTTDGVTAGSTATAQFGGMAVYTQVPVTINRGKPF